MPFCSRSQSTIHAFSVLAAGVGAGLAQVPGAQAPVLVGLQTAMIQTLAEEHGTPTSHTAATDLALTLGATMVGRTATA